MSNLFDKWMTHEERCKHFMLVRVIVPGDFCGMVKLEPRLKAEQQIAKGYWEEILPTHLQPKKKKSKKKSKRTASEAAKARWANMTPEQRKAYSAKIQAGKKKKESRPARIVLRIDDLTMRAMRGVGMNEREIAINTAWKKDELVKVLRQPVPRGLGKISRKSAAGRKRWANMTPEERAELGAKISAAQKRGSAHRSAFMKARYRNPEEREKLGRLVRRAQRARIAKMTPEERAAHRAKYQTQEFRGKIGKATRERLARMTREERSERIRKLWATVTPEERSARIKKVWAKRKANAIGGK